MSNFRGAENLRGWLEERGFKIDITPSPIPINVVNWYAWRACNLPVRRCEGNPDKPVLLAVHPWFVEIGTAHANVGIRGQTGGLWWSLDAYSMTEDEVMTRLDQVEEALARAWNALVPDVMGPEKPYDVAERLRAALLEGAPTGLPYWDPLRSHMRGLGLDLTDKQLLGIAQAVKACSDQALAAVRGA